MLVVKDAVALCGGFAGYASGVHTGPSPGEPARETAIFPPTRTAPSPPG